MKTIFSLFQNLEKNHTAIENGFNIAALPFVETHKIGISENGLPMFFIKCKDVSSVDSLDCNFDLISVQFYRDCQLFENKQKISQGIYTVISLKADSLQLQEYFVNIVALVLKRLAPNPSPKSVKLEVETLISLFNQGTKPPRQTIQGLWSELLVIERATDPEYMIKAWHSSPRDKYDFNDGTDKLEVKSTSGVKRIHSFSSEQLSPNKASRLCVASVFAVETGTGKTLFDLIRAIEKRVKGEDLLIRLNEIVTQTLGESMEKAFKMHFDYQLGVDSIGFYDAASIPKIAPQNIPAQLSNVHFDCDLSSTTPITHKMIKEQLYRSAFPKA